MTYHHYIDGDVLVYQIGFAMANKPDATLSLANYLLGNSIRNIRANIQQRFDVSDGCIFITSLDKSNFRFNIAKTKPYKGNRAGKDKPPFYLELRQTLIDRWGAVEVFGEEADDTMSIQASKVPEKSIISSIDKDLPIANCWHDKMDGISKPFYSQDPGFLSLTSGKRGQRTENLELFGTGIKFFYAQMLTGDDADNIPGIKLKGPSVEGVKRSKGYGAKLAYDLLNPICSEEALCNAVYSQYKARGYTFERFLEVGRLLWIRRKEGELWTPPAGVDCGE